MRRTERTVTAPADSGVVALDYQRANYQASIFVDIVSGTPTYSVQVTGDDIQADGYDPSTGSWQDHSALVGLNASEKGHLDFPATGLRLVTTGTGVARLVVLEGGSAGSAGIG